MTRFEISWQKISREGAKAAKISKASDPLRPSPLRGKPSNCTTTENWMTWMKGLKKRKQLTLGHPLQDGGKVLSGAKGKKVEPFKDAPDSIGGYLLIKAKSLAEATTIAKGCPIFNNGGTVELRAIQHMPGM